MTLYYTAFIVIFVLGFFVMLKSAFDLGFKTKKCEQPINKTLVLEQQSNGIQTQDELFNVYAIQISNGLIEIYGDGTIHRYYIKQSSGEK